MSSPPLPLTAQFTLPTNGGVGATSRSDQESQCTYLCGNSLGALPHRSKEVVQQELDVWGKRAVVGHFSHPHDRPWTKITDQIIPLFAELVGAKEGETACMATLTANLHLMMNSFYNPTSDRYKILCEARAFPSDQYAFTSQVLAHGLDPATTILEIAPREGEFTLRESDILDVLEKEGDSIALVLFSGVQYYTGQLFPMESITRKAKNKGCICGWDLAHAIGNVPLSLHDWEADFAVWCTYKYLNSGPGGIAGLYMHEKWNEVKRPRFAGWWGHELSTRFDMPPVFSPITGAQGFQQSNPPILAVASLLGSLQVFKEAGMMGPLRMRSLLLTQLLETTLVQSKYYIPTNQVHPLYEVEKSKQVGFTIITPSEPSQRGAQLSLLFLPMGSGIMRRVFHILCQHGVIGDERDPDVIRLAPIPLYNAEKDCYDAAFYLEKSLDAIIATGL